MCAFPSRVTALPSLPHSDSLLVLVQPMPYVNDDVLVVLTRTTVVPGDVILSRLVGGLLLFGVSLVIVEKYLVALSLRFQIIARAGGGRGFNSREDEVAAFVAGVAERIIERQLAGAAGDGAKDVADEQFSGRELRPFRHAQAAQECGGEDGVDAAVVCHGFVAARSHQRSRAPPGHLLHEPLAGGRSRTLMASGGD